MITYKIKLLSAENIRGEAFDLGIYKKPLYTVTEENLNKAIKAIEREIKVVRRVESADTKLNEFTLEYELVEIIIPQPL